MRHKMRVAALCYWSVCDEIVPAQHFIHLFLPLFTIITVRWHPLSNPVTNQRHTYSTCVTGFDIAFVFASSFVCLEKCVFCWVFITLIETQTNAFVELFRHPSPSNPTLQMNTPNIGPSIQFFGLYPIFLLSTAAFTSLTRNACIRTCTKNTSTGHL